MSVKVITTYTKKEIVSFSHRVTYLFRPALMIFLAVWTVPFLIAFILSCVGGKPEYEFLCYLLLWAFLNVFLFFLPYFSCKKNLALDSDVIFTLNEDGVTVEHTSGKLSGTQTIRYDAFYGVYETADRIYLMLNKKQGYPLDLSRIEEGSIDDLHALLMSHFPSDKYKRK